MLTVSDEARDYILSKKGTVHVIDNGRAGSCCGNFDLGPSVYLGKPPDATEYCVKEINQVAVYVPKNFYPRIPLMIHVGSFFGLKSLHIEGWKLM
ncbi:CC/Se motif family (seleno)protein [Pelosinus sp. UFO1]|uniref:CC/Se motif family (seleno)protein n=1 Tax=Pelosinus sp. UFO1 TaxID=484770 RepID=UPI0004D14A7E|nr:CC/Se motif family (seleno)protein [Pelosinus sp. UFO1]AIF53264.1 hypothetical protein UFO1_3721 [Pelosinus sp. UFO1]